MARKTTGITSTTRSKKTATSVSPAPVQVAPEVGKEIPKNGKSAAVVSANFVPSNLEEEIRRRAYELYLQRQATTGDANGDENQDWLMAEREIRSRRRSKGHHAA